MAEGGITSTREPARAHALLVLGLAAGVLGAAWSLARPAAEPLPDAAAARVGERLILRADWARAVAAVESERRSPLAAAERRRVLERLVEEELLVQHGLSLGMVEQDRRLRAQLVQDVLAGAPREPAPDEAVLRAHFEAHREWFAGAGRVRVVVHGPAPPVPDVLLTPAKLQAYLGPDLARAALALAPGQRSAPVDGVSVTLIERAPAAAPAFEDVIAEVRADWQRRADERAARALIDELRAQRDVTLAPDLR